MLNDKRITVLVDNHSWILSYAEKIVQILKNEGFEVHLVRDAENIQSGWINFMLGCTHIVSEKILKLNNHNLVIHESDLPKGRGFAPMTWQILEGKKIIPVCLVEAGLDVDAGDIWLRDSILLNGGELCDEWRALQGEKTVEMCIRFVKGYKTLSKEKQVGVPSNYVRRRPLDSRLDLNKTLGEQFNMLRVSDNDRYPASFEIGGQRYIIKIYKA